MGNIKAAARHAGLIGLPLNHFVTIAWEHGGVSHPGAATARFLKLFRDALGKRGFSSAWVWVHENGLVRGVHVHILLHLPRPMRKWFNRRSRGWMTLCSARRVKGLKHSRGVGHTGSEPFNLHMNLRKFDHDLGQALDYILKDANHDARRRYRIIRVGSCGEISGKRAGVSRNIDKGARRKWASAAQSY